MEASVFFTKKLTTVQKRIGRSVRATNPCRQVFERFSYGVSYSAAELHRRSDPRPMVISRGGFQSDPPVTDLRPAIFVRTMPSTRVYIAKNIRVFGGAQSFLSNFPLAPPFRGRRKSSTRAVTRACAFIYARTRMQT